MKDSTISLATMRGRLAALCARVAWASMEAEIADLSGLSRSVVYDLLKTDRPNVAFKTVHALAKLFGCDVAWLGAGEGFPFRGVANFATTNASATDQQRARRLIGRAIARARRVRRATEKAA